MKQGRSKNILIVAHYYPPHVGGIESVAFNQANKLARMGNKVTVITSKVSLHEKSGLINGVWVRRVPAMNFLEKWGVPFPIFSPSLIFSLIRSVKNSDIVHVHDAFYLSSFFAVLCASWYKKSIVLTQHVAIVPHPSKIVMLIQKIVYISTGAIVFRLSDKIIIFNDRIEHFLNNNGVPSKKLISLSNGVDVDFFHPASNEDKINIRKNYNLSLNKKITLFVGRFVPKKGFQKVLASQSSEYQIVLVGGDIPDQHSPDVIFLKQLSPGKLRLIYQASDLFVLPSEGEGFPLTIQEAMASGLPIITTDDDGYYRYNFDKKKICLIDHPTEQSVSLAIRSIINNDILLDEMSRYSRHYAMANFGWPRIIPRLDELYNDLLRI